MNCTRFSSLKKKTIKQKRIFNSAYLETVRDFSSICRFPLRRHRQNVLRDI